MSNWKLINKTYLYDGTFNGLLTIVFDSYSNKTLPQKIYNANEYTPNFLDKTEYIETDYEKSQRVFAGIEKNICYESLYNSYNAFLSNEKDKEIHISISCISNCIITINNSIVHKSKLCQ